MVQTTGVRLDDPDTFVAGVPHDLFRELRRERPVFWHDASDGPGFWVLTRHADVVTVSNDVATFSSARGTNIGDMRSGEELMMLNMDAPRHAQLRGLVSKGFTPKMVRAMEPHVRDIAARIIDHVGPLGECDFVTDVAAELPLQVIAELIGIPLEDRRMIFDWSNQMIGLDDPEYGNSTELAQAAAAQTFAYAAQLAARRRSDRRDDLISVLLDAEVDGEALTEQEFNFFFLLLAVAGNETTRNLIAGGMLALFEFPDQIRKMQADPELIPNAVEEMLRFVTPVMYFRRTATRDTEIRGERIRAGDRVTMWYIAANRDEDIFPDPDRFDAARDPSLHVTFGGGGSHFCLGNSLARLEIKIMFEELLRRLPDIEQAGPASRLRSNFISGIKHLPVRYTPERA